jgi:hypothetical protein
MSPILSQANLEWEDEPCHSAVGCRTSAPPWRAAGAISSDAALRGQGRNGPTSKFWRTASHLAIDVKGDGKREANETFYLDLFGHGGNALFTKYRGLGTILNDD